MRHGLVIVYTGNGKGKTTAAVGTVFRAWGKGFQICVIQFIKNSAGDWGEIRAARRLGLEWRTMGDGFTWLSTDLAQSGEKARGAWALAQEKIASGKYDLIVLDELTYAFHHGWLDANQVIAWLSEHRPAELHLIITGREAPAELIEFADLVTDMREVKHPYMRGIPAQEGIEF